MITLYVSLTVCLSRKKKTEMGYKCKIKIDKSLKEHMSLEKTVSDNTECFDQLAKTFNPLVTLSSPLMQSFRVFQIEYPILSFCIGFIYTEN